MNNKFAHVKTVTQMRRFYSLGSGKQQMKDSDYRIPKHEISIWKENGWKLSDCCEFMTLGKNKKVYIQ